MIPKFASHTDLKDFIATKLNGDKKKLYSLKKAAVKLAEPITYVHPTNEKIKQNANKGLQVRAIINTSNILDSHGDVHIPGLWTKSIKENKNFLHLQEHKQNFSHVISQEGTMSAKTIAWSELGFDYEGETQALVFDSDLTNSDNEYMVNLYKKGKVNQHSVGMQYVKMLIAVDSEESYC